MPKKFALIGAAGYIAPRHLQAIKANGGELLAALDPNDSVGILDSYFPETAFFTEFERFDRHLEKLKRKGQRIDYLSVCSPNYLHDAHCRFGLRYGADVICEKPLVLNSWNVDALAEIEAETDKRIYNILQLRLHPSVIALREKVQNGPKDKVYDIDLTYLTARGNWYYASWKGDASKSGGVAANIGIHFFDMLLWIFGSLKSSTVHRRSHDRAAGYLELERARVKWFLSINPDLLKAAGVKEGLRTHRSLNIEGEEFEFSGGFTELHDRSYAEIINGRGFGLDQVRAAVDLVGQVRKGELVQPVGPQVHSLAKIEEGKHPFRK
ncbi:oxidoreductase [Lewinellaceae bacterium SD302]|nr:oxidoreductase [Lewinellaceae bacterium SD302]